MIGAVTPVTPSRRQSWECPELLSPTAKTRALPSQISAPEASSEDADSVTLPPRIRSTIRTAVASRVAAASAKISAIETRRSHLERRCRRAGSAAIRAPSRAISMLGMSQCGPSDSRVGSAIRRVIEMTMYADSASAMGQRGSTKIRSSSVCPPLTTSCVSVVNALPSSAGGPRSLFGRGLRGRQRIAPPSRSLVACV